MLTATDITKSFTADTTTNVLKGVTIELLRGDFTCIIGRSGSGKSTLLNILSTLLRPDSGSVVYNGRDLGKAKAGEINRIRQNDFSVIFQSFHLLPYLTVLENVLLPYLSGVAPVNKKAKDKAMQIIERVGLEGKENRLPGKLSGGEQQRVSIARALVKEPKILFADEPTGSLDINTGKSIIELLKELNSDNLSVVMVTHALEYTTYADRVIEMKDGYICGQEESTTAGAV
ncbi:ABC transporter related protein [Denitrovibrio acetiphilus DSM 12809]|uniref:ABC transporter related protein n=1 Tax=Denitrovibrio acetiphilus (strain DSM 12809 / NBRC 114555 / N2460) TaxID=522772 RepID=D4H1H0_DENA2|nr:ABC transporter ATP-binding protein [Denitrovibrio acetiphilus]ADD68730.1 ABC transporter related protein [Denitrovibrio acetiphilus DSM 12809]